MEIVSMGQKLRNLVVLFVYRATFEGSMEHELLAPLKTTWLMSSLV
jgi:hypothetical protein